MIICVCRNINEERIVQEIKKNASFEELQMNLGVAVCCGSCRGSIECLIKKHQPQKEETLE